MSSGFVSSGVENSSSGKVDAWALVQKEINEAATRNSEAPGNNTTSSGKSLFEILEGNKAAKQEAFEEARRLRNQFRALDEDEIDFLDSVLEGTRTEEARVKKETLLGVRSFRRQQAEVDQKSRAGSELSGMVPAFGEDTWKPITGSRKRRRVREKIYGVKRKNQQKSFSDGENSFSPHTTSNIEVKHSPKFRVPCDSEKLPEDTKCGLVNYGSDDE